MAIVRSILPVFASKGFHGATTRELAQAAGVSEALLYKHFDSKEAMFAAITELHYTDDRSEADVARIWAMEPGTERLVATVQYLVAHIARKEGETMPRLMAHSLTGDGAFARVFLKSYQREVGPFLVESFEAACAAGDAEGEASAESGLWFVQHLAMMLKWMRMPEPDVVNYRASRREVVRQAVYFALRGLGVREAMIDRYYDPVMTRRVL